MRVESEDGERVSGLKSESVKLGGGFTEKRRRGIVLK